LATTGTYGFDPQLADYIDEASERCGIDPADLKARHVRSAIRSANLMFADWQNWGFKQHTLDFVSTALDAGAGQTTFLLPVGCIDIFHATLKRDGNESEMYPISRSDYNALHDKTLQGRPDRYFVDRGSFIGASPQSTVYLWQATENITDTIEAWCIRSHEDAGDPMNTLDINSLWFEAFAAGLAYMLSFKFAPERTDQLKTHYLGRNFDEFKNSIPGGALGRAMSNDRDTSDAVLRVRFDRYRGRR
jgi:hypothetical protein